MNAWAFYSKIAWRNLHRHWRRSLAAILSIAAGSAALNLFEGYIADAKNIFAVTYEQRLMYGDILIHQAEAFKHGPWDDGTHLVDLPQQKALEKIFADRQEAGPFVRFLNLTGLVANGATTAVFVGYGYDVERGQVMRRPTWEWNTLAGRPLDNNGGHVLLGRGLGKLLECLPTTDFKTISPTGGYQAKERPFKCLSSALQLTTTDLQGATRASTVEVRGLIDAVYREVDARMIVMPLEKAQALMATQGVSFYGLRTQRPHSTARALNRTFKQENLALTARPWRRHPYGDIYVQSMDFLSVFRTFTLIVVLTIVGLSVSSTLLRLVQERIREMGTLLSLGYRRRQVRGLFMAEVVLVALLGNAIGIAVALVTAMVMNNAGILYKIGILSEDVPFHIILPPANFALSALVLTVISLTAGSLAIRRALRLSIPDCLSHR